MVQSLRDENAQLTQQSKAHVEEATEPLQQELLVEKEKANNLPRQLKEMDKDNKFLSAELKSLEDSLLSTLDKHSRVEKLSNEKVADLQKQLEHAQKALMVMKNAMVDTPDKSVMVDVRRRQLCLMFMSGKSMSCRRVMLFSSHSWLIMRMHSGSSWLS